jgi:hypothetical protein
MLKKSMKAMRLLALIAVTGAPVSACDNTPTSTNVPATSAPHGSRDGRIYDPKWGLRRP